MPPVHAWAAVFGTHAVGQTWPSQLMAAAVLPAPAGGLGHVAVAQADSPAQPFEMAPQPVAPPQLVVTCAAVRAVHELGTHSSPLSEQYVPPVHVPQLTVPLHPSLTLPQIVPVALQACDTVLGEHGTHAPLMQTSPPEHVPQLHVSPHWSFMSPQLIPAEAQAAAWAGAAVVAAQEPGRHRPAWQ